MIFEYLIEPLPVYGQIQQTTNWYIYFLIFPRKQDWNFMQIGDNLYEMA